MPFSFHINNMVLFIIASCLSLSIIILAINIVFLKKINNKNNEHSFQPSMLLAEIDTKISRLQTSLQQDNTDDNRYLFARYMIANGATVDEIIQKCHVSYGEVELLTLFK